MTTTMFRFRVSAAVALIVLLAVGLVACGRQPAIRSPGGHDRSEAEISRDWLVTVYYTAVESFHSGNQIDVRGCPTVGCVRGNDPLGRYPETFVAAVREEGAGRITTGRYAGKYLNWSYDVGYWLDTTTRDSHGRPLVPFRTAAADGLPDGTQLRIADCGRIDGAEPVPPALCRKLRDSRWEIRDAFTPGLGGKNHVDLYIGEENQQRFTTSSALYVTLNGAAVTISEP